MFFQLATIATVVGTAVAQRTFVVYNGCPFTVWPALYTSGGGAPSQTTGWEADEYTHVTFSVPNNWNGRIWGRRECDFSSGSTLPSTCVTGGCDGGLVCTQPGVPPATLAEFNLDASGTDYYDISNVDGSDLPMEIWVDDSSCTSPICLYDLDSNCPSALQVTDSAGYVIGCDSACYKFGGDNNCCTGADDTPATCPSSGVEYYSYFHDNCPQAYAYAYDDDIALFTCPSASATQYTVTFCPPSS